MCTCAFPAFKIWTTPICFLPLSKPNVSIPALTVGVKLEWCQQIFTRCLCGALGRSSSCLLFWETHMEVSLLLIIHVVNLTSNLIELWQLSAALALFTLPMTGLNYFSSSQPSSIDPSRSESLACLAVVSPRLPQFLHSFYLPFILSSHVCYNPDQF